MASRSITSWKSAWLQAPSSQCPPSRLKEMPTERRIRSPTPTPRSSPVSTSTERSMGASVTISRRKPHRPSPKLLWTSAAWRHEGISTPAPGSWEGRIVHPLRRLPLAVVVCAIGLWCGAARAELKSEEHPLTFSAAQLPVEGSLPSLDGATDWINTPPMTQLHGRVVVVEFWTYTCINWRRNLLYVRAWADKYRDQGLVVIGVHAPEFAFEKDLNNVRRAVKDLGVDYPVAVDSEHLIWRAFRNQYWPALYFVDVQGRVRHHHFGEGSYEQSEMIIRELLAEAGRGGIDGEPVSVEAQGLGAA